MILHDGEESVTVQAHGAKAGHQFTSIELTAEDFQLLVRLSPDALMDWVERWQLGFRPTQ